VDSLSIESEREEGVPVIWLRGELDRLTAEDLDTAVRELASKGSPMLVLDVSELEFIDSAGLRSLSRAHNLLRDADHELVVRRPSPSVMRLFELVGLHEILRIDTT
jgi:anti-anti-sigma factor